MSPAARSTPRSARSTSRPAPAAARLAPRRRAVSEAEKSKRRASIVSAAKKVFARRGFHGTTMADVAKAARLSYGSVYWYFDSKDSLFHALMDEEEQALRGAIAAAIAADIAAAGDDDPERLLRAAVRATFEFFEADRAAVTLLFRDSYALGSRFEKHLFGLYERFIDDLEGLIADGSQRQVIIDVPPKMAAFSVAALVAQLALRRLSADDGLSAPAAADFVVDLVFEGLRPR